MLELWEMQSTPSLPLLSGQLYLLERQKKQWNIVIAMKHLQMNQISALNNPWGVDMPLNKPNLWYYYLNQLTLNLT